MAALIVRRPTRHSSSIARPDIPAAAWRRIAANSSIFDIRGIGRHPSRISRCFHRQAWCRARDIESIRSSVHLPWCVETDGHIPCQRV